MKCPKCGFISFDSLNKCKKCGQSFKLLSDSKMIKTNNIQHKIKGNDRNVENIKVSEKPSDYEIFESIKKDIDEMVVTENNIRPPNIDKTFADIKKELEEIENLSVDGSSPTTGGSVAVSSPKEYKSETGSAFYNASDNRYAGFFIRLLAYSIDNIILAVISVILFAAACLMLGSFSLLEDDPLQILYSLYVPFIVFSSIIEMFYFTYFHAVTGQTVGKWICGIKVVGEDGNNLGFKKAFIRFLGYLLSRFAVYIGFVWIAFDNKKQGWHDKIAKSIVV